MSRFSRFFELCVNEVVFAAALGCVVQSVKARTALNESFKAVRGLVFTGRTDKTL